MTNYSTSLRWKLPTIPFRRLLLLALLLAGARRGGAQAPPWQLAVCSSNSSSTAGESGAEDLAVDAAGNVFVTGWFTGSVTFGTIVLNSAGGNDVFVTKWDATAQAFTWAVSGGGTGFDRGQGIAVSGANVFVTGVFESGGTARFAGQLLPGAGLQDMFVAKFTDTSTGHTAASSSFANGWATSGGGTSNDAGNGIAVRSTGVFVAGDFSCGTNAIIAGRALPGVGTNNDSDVFVAKYVDTSTGSAPATSSFANGWAVSGGGLGTDVANGLVVSGAGVFVTGQFTSNSNAIIAGQTLVGAGGTDIFVAKFLDTSTGSAPASSSFANGWATSGGGTSYDVAYGIAVRGTGVFVTGGFGSNANARFAGQVLAGLGSTDVFVAKYLDTSTGNTPLTSSVANGWATSGGTTYPDVGKKIAVSGTSVFVTGVFSGTNAHFAGQVVAGTGGYDVFVAKYLDTSTNSTPAASSFTNGWATYGGGSGDDLGTGIAVGGQQLYATGLATPPATFGSVVTGIAGTGYSYALARLTDPTLPLATVAPAAPASILTLAPNPSTGRVAVAGAAPGAAVAVCDALGRRVLTATADATGTAQLLLPAGLAPGVYVVRGGGQARRLAVE